MHAAIVSTDVAAALRAGTKTVESRFSRTRRSPFGRVRPGDLIQFKLAGGPVVGAARAVAVRQFDALTPVVVRRLRRRYGAAIQAAPAYWRRRLHARYGVLIWLTPLGPPLRRRIPRQYGGGWVVLGASRR